MMKNIGVLASLGMVALAGLVGCDLAKQATSNQVMLAQVLATPDESVAGHTVQGKVGANVFLGTRDPANLSAPPTPTTGATVQVSFNNTTVSLPEKGNGNYAAEGGNLAYVPGTTYTFTATVGSESFSETVQAPERETIKEFHEGLLAPDAGGLAYYPDGGYNLDSDGGYPFVLVHAGQNLTLTRPPPDGERNIALTIVVPVTDQGPQSPSFTDPPMDAAGLIQVLVDPSKYQQDTITVDGSKAWPACPPNDYLITVTAMKKGQTQGNNLFLGSTALAGSADAAPARCQ